jgi:acylphosphatase
VIFEDGIQLLPGFRRSSLFEVRGCRIKSGWGAGLAQKYAGTCEREYELAERTQAEHDLFSIIMLPACATLDTGAMSRPNVIAKRYFIRGRVQGVGYRYFAQRMAADLHISGYTRNLDDGRVEVYAVGTSEQLSELAGRLWKGPRFADVRGVEECEAGVQQYGSFHIEA